MNTADMSLIRVNLTLPQHVWGELARELPQRGRSKFITSAIEEKLRREKMKKAFAELASLPPAFSAITDSASYVSTMRKEEDVKRGKRISV